MTMRTPLLIIAVACALATVLLPAAPLASQPVTEPQIAFTSGRGGVFEVWGVNGEVDASAVKLVTGPPGSIEVDPAWDPADTGDVAFARKSAEDETFDLFVKPDGVSATKLTDEEAGASNDRQPDWAVNGEIAFTRSVRADDTTHIWKVPSGGGSAVQLTSTPAPGYDASPSWNGLGTQIAFVSDRSGTPQLWTMSSDGTGQTQRTFGSCFVSNPDWSPDDAMIVYEQQCPGGGADLYSAVTTNPTWVGTQFVIGDTSDHQPAFSPDGNRVLFTRIESSGDKQLYAVNKPPTSGIPMPIGGNDPEQADMSADWGSFVATARTTSFRPTPDSDRTAIATRGPAKPGGKGSKSRKVTKGVRFLQMRKAKSDVYVLKVDPKKIPRIDVALSNDALPGHEKTRRMAKRHKAVAGINGDFGTESGRPSHTFAEDGDLKQVSFAVAPTFAITADEQQTTFDRPQETVTAAEQDTWQIERWNFGAPPFTDISAFTPAGGTLEVPPSNACAVRLLPIGGRRWAPNNAGVEVDYMVNEVSCSTTPMAVNGGVVLAARPGSDGAILIGSLTSGETVSLTWSIGFPSVLDTVGGTPLLVENGAVVAKPCNESICKRHPRTAIGVTSSGRILMVVVDGRRKDSKGVTLVKLANVMQGLGASFALNLDGGGSSTMVVKGKKGGLQVVNKPSDGNQRKVSSAVLVIKGKDPGEVIGAPIPRLPSASAPEPATDRAGERAVLDPASTGGLAEALAEGTFGRPVELPRELRRALRAFRSSR
jgi:Phosphodiester glycosidase/WD40-like Beta Propeller Repeat